MHSDRPKILSAEQEGMQEEEKIGPHPILIGVAIIQDIIISGHLGAVTIATIFSTSGGHD